MAKNIFLTEESEETGVVLCPTCGYNCTHLESTEVDIGGRTVRTTGTGTELLFRPNAAGMGHGRGAVVTLQCWGECGHRFTVGFWFHKGSIYFEVKEDGSADDQMTGCSNLWRD